MMRQPAVAGTFYPQDKTELLNQLSRFFSGVRSPQKRLGVISPHAGYVYSGAIAAQLFSETDLPEQIILLGPNHHGMGSDIALWREGSWATPLGEVPVASSLADHLLQRCPLLEPDQLAHRYEHSIEVQVPLLRYLQPQLSIVPICLGRGTLDDWLRLGRDIGQALLDWPQDVLIVASSDMSHFLDEDETRRLDQLALDAALALDPTGLYRTVRDHDISMCGVIPAVVMLEASLIRGATDARLVRYGHSGEVNGDRSRVVGYAGVAIS